MLRPEDRESGRLRARSAGYRKRVDAAHGVIAAALESFAPMFVAFSCGKDSAVLFDLVREVDPTVEGRFVRWPETRWIDDFDRVLDEWDRRGARLSVLDLSRESLAERVPDRWLRLRETSPAGGSFVGLRGEESSARRITLKIHGLTHVAKDGFARCCPIGWWQLADVAAACAERDLPLLSAYSSGIGERTVARVPRDSVRDVMLSDLRERDMAGYREVLRIYPELAGA